MRLHQGVLVHLLTATVLVSMAQPADASEKFKGKKSSPVKTMIDDYWRAEDKDKVIHAFLESISDDTMPLSEDEFFPSLFEIRRRDDFKLTSDDLRKLFSAMVDYIAFIYYADFDKSVNPSNLLESVIKLREKAKKQFKTIKTHDDIKKHLRSWLKEMFKTKIKAAVQRAEKELEEKNFDLVDSIIDFAQKSPKAKKAFEPLAKKYAPIKEEQEKQRLEIEERKKEHRVEREKEQKKKKKQLLQGKKEGTISRDAESIIELIYKGSDYEINNYMRILADRFGGKGPDAAAKVAQEVCQEMKGKVLLPDAQRAFNKFKKNWAPKEKEFEREEQEPFGFEQEKQETQEKKLSWQPKQETLEQEKEQGKYLTEKEKRTQARQKRELKELILEGKQHKIKKYMETLSDPYLGPGPTIATKMVNEVCDGIEDSTKQQKALEIFRDVLEGMPK